ncbi:hypothetical protein ACFFIF_02545 [Vagococcus entomophilus]|uniref:Uncharacterized protein n=1 Tax=Vagococcus entomophilus TaxID=1160095 RepID=A0A430AJQ9_9ENTE|nr:hypothetical protein [Vagococcus entomophilus]RSU08325.1 hypothetical protein CBF30_03535 [Vagococcus entomophilus]
MSMEEDYLLKQLKMIGEAAGNAIATTFNLERSKVDLGQEEDENGNLISGNELLEEYLNKRKIHKAFLLIKSKKYSLSYLEMSTLTTYFIKFLQELSNEEKLELEIDSKKIDYYKLKLNEL